MEKLARQNQSAQNSDKKGKASTYVWIDNDFITRDNLLDNNYYGRSIMDDDIFSSFNLQKSAGDAETDPVVYPKPRHGIAKDNTQLVTNMKKGKSSAIIGGTELTVKGESGEYYEVEVYVDDVKKSGSILKSQIDLTPDRLEDVPLDQRQKIRIDASAQFGLTAEYSTEYKRLKTYNVNYNNIPAPLHLTMQKAIEAVMKSGVSYGNQNRLLSEQFRTATFKVEYGDIYTKEGLSSDEVSKYQNNTFAYRITRLGNNHDKPVLMIEELGKINPAATEKKDKSELKFYKYGFSFHEATPEQIKDAEAVKTEYEANGITDLMISLDKNAFLEITSTEKEAIEMAVEKIPDSALEQIKGVVFNKKYYLIDEATKSLESAAAYYSPDKHSVTIISDITQDYDQVFGDKPESGFSSGGTKTILHELGHAVDYVPYRTQHAVHENYDKNELATANTAITTAKETFLDARGKVIEKYKKLKITFTDIVKNDKGQITNFHYTGATDVFNKLEKELKALRKIYDKEETSYNAVKAQSDLLTQKASESRTLTGYGQAYDETSKTWIPKEDATEFDAAVAKDSPLLTLYSSKSDQETFADAFALYVAAPETLKILSPNVYAYFKLKYP